MQQPHQRESPHHPVENGTGCPLRTRIKGDRSAPRASISSSIFRPDLVSDQLLIRRQISSSISSSIFRPDLVKHTRVSSFILGLMFSFHHAFACSTFNENVAHSPRPKRETCIPVPGIFKTSRSRSLRKCRKLVKQCPGSS